MNCEKCNTEMRFVARENILDTRLEQYHCPNCHHTIVKNLLTGTIREGHLEDRGLNYE